MELRKYNSAGNYDFVDSVIIGFAQNFQVYNHKAYKVAHIHYQSEQRGVAFDQKIIFTPKGNPQPSLSEDLIDAWVIEVPLETVAANDDGEITRIRTLDLIESIVGMGGGGIYDTILRKRWERKLIASIGYSFHQIPQPEVVLSLNPDLLLLHSHDHDRLEAVYKMRKLGINAIPQFAWAEPTFLGRAEWLKFTALFFNKEKTANELFSRIVRRCQELSLLVEGKSPKVKAFMTYFPSSESDWSAHRNDFYASFLEAAGAENVLKDDGPTHPVGINHEELLTLAGDADVWIVNNTSDTEWPPASYLQSFKAYRSGQVYHYQKRTRYEHNAYDWYETPEIRPDLVLEDLVSIFYPDLMPDHELIFFESVQLNKL